MLRTQRMSASLIGVARGVAPALLLTILLLPPGTSFPIFLRRWRARILASLCGIAARRLRRVEDCLRPLALVFVSTHKTAGREGSASALSAACFSMNWRLDHVDVIGRYGR